MCANNVGLDSFEVVIGQPHLRGLAAAQIVPDHIASFNQLVKKCVALVAFEIQRHAFFSEVKSLKIGAVVLCEGDRP